MTRLITAEIFKLRTTRTFYGIVGGAFGLVFTIVIIASATATWNPGDVPMRDLLGIAGLTQVFALVLGIVALTSEFRHGTITPSLLIVPDRVRLTLAKLGASLATAAGIPDSRVEELLRLVGLADAANRRAGGYSLGMRQRLGLAAALRSSTMSSTSSTRLRGSFAITASARRWSRPERPGWKPETSSDEPTVCAGSGSDS